MLSKMLRSCSQVDSRPAHQGRGLPQARPFGTARPRASQASRLRCEALPAQQQSRRQALAMTVGTGLALALQGLDTRAGICEEAGVEILSDAPGFGKHAARKGDLLLLHYVGTLKDTGAVFDSTRGGLMYRDGGNGVNRPVIIRLGGDPVPGICTGLKKGLEGMTVGGKRTFVVPPELGFKGTVLAPYSVVPAGSTLQYEVELIRLSNRGPDELTKGIDRCGQGGAAQQVVNCDQIEPGEFVLKF